MSIPYTSVTNEKKKKETSFLEYRDVSCRISSVFNDLQ